MELNAGLSGRDERRFVAALAFEWAVIVALFAVAARVHHPAMWVAATFLLGTRQHALGVLGHEGVHHCALRNRRLNDLVAQTLCFWPLCGDLHGYRAFHLAHHRFLNTDRDPELGYRRKGAPAWDVPQTRTGIAFRLLLDLTGLGAPEMFRILAVARPPTLSGYVRLIAAYSTTILILYATGALWVVGMWFAAAMSSFVAVFRMRYWLEHLGSESTHRVHVPTWMRWWMAPHFIWLHWEHHKWPGLPHRRLRTRRAHDRSVPVVSCWELLRSYSHVRPVASGTPTIARPARVQAAAE